MASTRSARRRKLAEQALATLGSHRSDRQMLSVQCSASHHLAAVYDTPAGPVFVARMGRHAHGDRDLVDTPHRGSREEYVDLLDSEPSSERGLPAWCDCGPHVLSRSSLRRAVAAGDHLLRVD
jgi:hypothetical protein